MRAHMCVRNYQYFEKINYTLWNKITLSDTLIKNCRKQKIAGRELSFLGKIEADCALYENGVRIEG